jgi:hypothetical protein
VAGGARLERPGSDFATLNPVLKHGYERLIASHKIQQLRELSRRVNSRALFLITRTMRRRIANGISPDDSREFGVNSIFSVPDDWSAEQRIAFNIEQYKKYIRLMHATSGELGLKEAYFVQPCPAIGKTLTAQEKDVVEDLDYAPVYQQMADELVSLNARGIPAVSLLDCFAEVSETVYADNIHCDPDGPGYRILAERLADELALLWNVPKK